MLPRGRFESTVVRSMRGFTILEILVTLLALALLTAVAQPNLAEMTASFDRKNARQILEFDLRRARSESLSKGVRVVITLAADGKSYTVGDDLLPYDLVNGNVDNLQFTTVLPRDVSLSFSGSGADSNKLIFSSHGFLSDIAGNRNTSQKIVTISYKGTSFATATVYPVGVARFSL